MSTPRTPPSPRRRVVAPRVTLCASLTFDGKLDAADPLSSRLLASLAPEADDAWLVDAVIARRLAKLPSALLRETRVIAHPAAPTDLPRLLKVTPPAPPVRRWLCLGGPILFRALLDAGLVHDLRLLVRPRIDGRRNASTLSGPPTPAWFPRSLSCRLRRLEVCEGNCLLHYTVAR